MAIWRKPRMPGNEMRVSKYRSCLARRMSSQLTVLSVVREGSLRTRSNAELSPRTRATTSEPSKRTMASSSIIPRTSEAGTTAFIIRLRRPRIIKANDDSAIMSRPMSPRAPFAARLSGLRPRVCRSGLAGKPFTKHVRLHLPRKRSGHEGVHDAVQPAWNDSGTVFEQTAEALRYALLDAHRFQRHGLRIEAELFEHRCVRKPGCQYSDVDT